MDKKKKLYKSSKADFAIALVIILLSLIPVISASTNKAHEALVYKNNQLLQTIPLDKNAIINEGPLTVEVDNGAIRVKDADCPNQICVHEGWISKPGQSIVCLPNKIIVEIPNNDSDDEYNAVTR